MNAGAAKIVVDSFVQNGFDALDAMLGLSFSKDAAEPDDITAEEIGGIAEEHPVWMRAKTRNRSVVQARHIPMLYAKDMTRASLATIGAH